MSEQNSQEPTMEEILASIRRIISEDEAPAAAAEEPAAVHAPEPVLEEPLSTEHGAISMEDDVLELTDRIEEPPVPQLETLGDLDVFSAGAAPPPAPNGTRSWTSLCRSTTCWPKAAAATVAP